MDKDLKEQWDKFLSGHWQREIPEKRGNYRTATLDGDLCQDRIVVYYDKGIKQTCPSWGGWFWSEPTPDLPSPPKL